MPSLWKSCLAVVLLFVSSVLASAEPIRPYTIERLREALSKPADQQPEAIQELVRKLSKSQVPTEEAAEKLALGALHKQVGIDAREKWHVTQLFSIGRDVPEFAKEGDLVWEVHFSRWGLDHVSGVVWVSTTTKQARVLFPMAP